MKLKHIFSVACIILLVAIILINCDMTYTREGDYTFQIYDQSGNKILKEFRVQYWTPTRRGYLIQPFGEKRQFEITGNIKIINNKNKQSNKQEYRQHEHCNKKEKETI